MAGVPGRSPRVQRHSARVLWTAVLVAVAVGYPTATRAADFQGLGLISAKASGVSGDGLVVVGSGYAGPNCTGTEGWRWTAAGGVVGMGCLPGGSESRAIAASFDGSVIVGGAGTSVFAEERAVRSVGGGAWEELSGDLVNKGVAFAWDVSDDGVTIVGGTLSDDAFYWNSVDEETYFLSNGAFFAGATGVAADGTMSAVASFNPFASNMPGYHVTAAGVATTIPALPPPPGAGINGSAANDISTDGSTIVGVALAEAYRWTSAEGSVGLGHLFPGSWNSWGANGLNQPFSNATAVSADGSVIVGWAAHDALGDEEYDYSHPEAERAFIWGSTRGMRDLKIHLENRGVDLTGWTLTMATGISNDGRVVVGNGINPSGQVEPWIADVSGPIPNIPATGPLGLWLLASFLLLAALRRA